MHCCYCYFFHRLVCCVIVPFHSILFRSHLYKVGTIWYVWCTRTYTYLYIIFHIVGHPIHSHTIRFYKIVLSFSHSFIRSFSRSFIRSVLIHCSFLLTCSLQHLNRRTQTPTDKGIHKSPAFQKTLIIVN